MKKFFAFCGVITLVTIWTPVFWAYHNEATTPGVWKVIAGFASWLGTIGFMFKGQKD